MNILLLKGFNNYFNRIVKKYSTLADYKSNSAEYLEFASINFNPNDGVSTTLIVGGPTQTELVNNTKKPLNWVENGTPDYCIVYEPNGSLFHPDGTIKSRWFVLESEFTRNGQYKIALKRDVIADHLNEIFNAPCFVEKGIISEASNPLLFNKEATGYNQIKQSETLLKDKTGTAWIIGYVSQDKTGYGPYESSSSAAALEDYADLPQLVKDFITLGEAQMPASTLNTSSGNPAGRCRMTVSWAPNPNNNVVQTVRFTNVPWIGEAEVLSTSQTGNAVLRNTDGEALFNANTFPMYLGFNATTEPRYNNAGAANMMRNIRFNSTLRSYYINNKLTNGVETLTDAQQAILRSYDDRYIVKDGQTYHLEVKIWSAQYGPDWNIYYNPSDPNYTQVYNEISGVLSNAQNQDNTFFRGTSKNSLAGDVYVNEVSLVAGGTAGSTLFCKLAWEYQRISATLTLVEAAVGSKVKASLPAGRNQCCDTPMDLFAIPYSDNFEVITTRDSETDEITSEFHTNKAIALQAATAVCQAGNVVYDIQVLPYFPDLSLIGEDATDIAGKIFNNAIDLSGNELVENTDYNFITNSSNAKIGVMFWSRKSVFTFDIFEQLQLANTDALSLKVSNECDLFRLTAPNYSSSFEFSLAKSGGSINKFNVDCTYKPFDPYIHVVPELTGLYGQNFLALDDARGLICSGDYSLARYTDAWAQYQLQNKNYQAIFNREIQNMDVKHQLERDQFAFNFEKSLWGMAASLPSARSIIAPITQGIFNPYYTSMGGLKESEWMETAQKEAKDYTRDMYNYNLQTIQAQPNGLAKTTAITNNNKLFPIIEYYTCTDLEKQALENKLRYNGMSVMVVDTLQNYSYSEDFDKVYVKGQMIRLDNINDDFHVADAIYQEVNKGFFVIQGE